CCPWRTVMQDHPRRCYSFARCWMRMKKFSRNIYANPSALPSRPLPRPTLSAKTRNSDPRTLEALLSNDVRAFVHKTFNTLSPGQTYVRSLHVDAIAYQLERVRR